jgi:ribosomal protein S18 acetylase RimI-like enzyme
MALSSGSDIHVTLRPATSRDAGFAYTVEEDAMRVYAEQTWGHWSPAADREGHVASFSPESHRVVVVGQEPVGIVAVEEEPGHLLLAKLYLLAPYRNLGIGSRVLEGVLRDGRSRCKPVKLRVLTVNTRAQTFYRRHGFTVERADDERIYMVSVHPC